MGRTDHVSFEDHALFEPEYLDQSIKAREVVAEQLERWASNLRAERLTVTNLSRSTDGEFLEGVGWIGGATYIRVELSPDGEAARLRRELADLKHKIKVLADPGPPTMACPEKKRKP